MPYMAYTYMYMTTLYVDITLRLLFQIVMQLKPVLTVKIILTVHTDTCSASQRSPLTTSIHPDKVDQTLYISFRKERA